MRLSVHAQLTSAAASDPQRGGVLTELAGQLQIASGHRDSRVVLVLDQVEELLGAVASARRRQPAETASGLDRPRRFPVARDRDATL